MLKHLRQYSIIQYKISTLLRTRNPYSYSHFEIFICIYSVRGEIVQIYIKKYVQMYYLLCSKCLHFCLHIYWSPYST